MTVRYSLTTMACGLGPLIESGIQEVAGTLPFDLEPASFLLVQTAKVSK